MTTETVTAQLANGLSCELPADSPLAKLLKTQRTWVGPSAKERLKILQNAQSVAIVGASPNAARSSYFVGTYLLQSSNFRVYFVNPNADEILGHKTYPDLASLPEVPDVVDVFRKASDIPAIIDEVVAIGASTVWGNSVSGTRMPRSMPRVGASRWSWTAASRSSMPASTVACTCSVSTPA